MKNIAFPTFNLEQICCSCLDLAYSVMSDLHLLSLLAVERSDIGHFPNNKLLVWPWQQDMLKGDFDLCVIQYTHLDGERI